MKVYYNCGSCFLKQAHEALEIATDDDNLRLEVLSKIFKLIAEEYQADASSNKLGTHMHRLIKKETLQEDLFIEDKERCNKLATSFLPKVNEMIKENNDLETYIKIAIVGNLLDSVTLGIGSKTEQTIAENLEKELAINDIQDFEKTLNHVDSVLYLADNTGEIVFDKLLIQKLLEYDVKVTFAVKDKPILNDACMKDALDIGLDEVAELVTTGTDSVGIVYEDLSEEFRDRFDNAEMIISKGLGNYEGITELKNTNNPIFFLLSVKCQAIAKDIGAEMGSNVLKKYYN